MPLNTSGDQSGRATPKKVKAKLVFPKKPKSYAELVKTAPKSKFPHAPAKKTPIARQDSSAGDAARRVTASVVLATQPKKFVQAAAARGELVRQGDTGPSVAGPTTTGKGKKTLTFKDAAHQRAHQERTQEAKIGRANRELAMTGQKDPTKQGPQLQEAKPAARAASAAAAQSQATAAQRRKDDQSIREVGTFERRNPSTPLEKQAEQRAKAAKKTIRLRATPRTKKTLDLLDRTNPARAERDVRAMGRQKTRSVSKREADQTDRATKDLQAQDALDKKRSKLTVGNLVGNTARSLKDSVSNPVPIVQVLAKAGKEEVHRLAAGAAGKHADAPTADALAKSVAEHDPIIQTIKHGPKAGLRAAVRDPPAALTEVAPLARGVRTAVDVAKAGGSIKAAKEAERLRRVRPTQRVTNTKTAPLKGKAGRARLKTDVAEARTGHKVDARVTGPVRTYDHRLSVRAAQKAKDAAQASRGKDPVRLTGRKGQKLERRHQVSEIARQKIVSQNRAGAARDGSSLSSPTKKGPPDVLQRHRGFVQRVEAKATPKQRIVAGELATHIDGASGHTVGTRMRELAHQIGEGRGGPLWQQQHDLKAKQLREGGETSQRRIDRVATAHADAQVKAARQTGGALADFQRYANDLLKVRPAYEKAHTEAEAAHRAYADATPGHRDAEMKAMFDANKRLLEARKAVTKVEARHSHMVEAEQLAHARAQFGRAVTEHHIETGDLDPTSASMRLKMQLAVAHGKLRHDPSAPSGWRNPKTGKEVTLEQIDKMPEAPTYMHYGINASHPEVVIGKQLPGTGFTGAGVHGYDFASRPLSEVHGGQFDKMGQNDLAKHLLDGAVTGPEGRLSADSADRVAAARSQATGVKWEKVKAGRVDAKYSHEWHDPEMNQRPKHGEDGYVVMPKAKADLWHEQMKPMGRLATGGQLVTRRFLRGVLGLNPGWIAGNNMDGALRSLAAGASPLKGGKDVKLVEALRAEGGLGPGEHLATGAAAHDGGYNHELEVSLRRFKEAHGKALGRGDREQALRIEKAMAAAERQANGDGYSSEAAGAARVINDQIQGPGSHVLHAKGQWARGLYDSETGHVVTWPMEGRAGSVMHDDVHWGRGDTYGIQVDPQGRAHLEFPQEAPVGAADRATKAISDAQAQPGLDSGGRGTGAAEALGAHAGNGVPAPDVTPVHPNARKVFDSLLGHTGTNRYAVPKDIRDFMNSGQLTNGLRKAGIRTSVGEKLHKVARPWTDSAVRRHGNDLIDKSLDFSSRLEERWIRAAQGKAAKQLAKELGIAVHEHRALAHRILDDPAAADRFHELTLNIVGDYIRRSPKTRHWQTTAVPFMPWIKAALKWTMHTLPADHPLKLAMYLQAASATEEQRRTLGMSDWISAKEAKAMNLPKPVDGFLTGAATVAPGWVVPFAGMFSPGAVGQMIDDPVKYAGRSIVPQVGTIAAKALGQTGSLPERAMDELTDVAGITKNAGVGRLHLGLPGAMEAGIRTILTYVPGAARAVGPLGLGKQIQGGLGPTQTGSYDAQGKLDTGRPKSVIGDAIGMGAQSIPNEPPNVSVGGLKPYETKPEALAFNEVTNGFEPGLVTKADQIKASSMTPLERAKANAKQIGQPTHTLPGARLATGAYSTAFSGTQTGLDYFRDSAQGPLIQKAPSSPKEIRIMAQGIAKEGVPKAKDLAHPEIAKDPNYLKALRLAKTLPAPAARVGAPRPSAAAPEALAATPVVPKGVAKPADLHGRAAEVAKMPPGAERDAAAKKLSADIKRHVRFLKSKYDGLTISSGPYGPSGAAPDPTTFTTSGGKIVPVPGFPGEEAAQGIVPAIEAVSKKYGLTMTDAFDRSGTKHKSPGHEVTGTAADFAGSDAAMTKAAHDLAAQGYLVGYDGTGGTKDWPGHGPSTKAGANAHLHVEFVGSGAPSRGTVSGGTGGSTVAVHGPTNPDHGPDAWARHILKAGKFPLTPANVTAMTAWARAEGGHFNNDSKYNPLNTTQPEPGAGNTGTQGNIKVYNSWRQGDKATLTTLHNGHYGAILAALKKGDSAEAVAQAIGASPWGTTVAGIMGALGATGGGAVSSSPGTFNGASGVASTTSRGASADITAGLVDPSLSPEERSAQLTQLIATLSGGHVDPATGNVVLPRKRSSAKATAAASNMDPVSRETKQAKARIRRGR